MRTIKIALLSITGFLPTITQADDWLTIAGISPTATLEANHLCYSDGRDIACGDRDFTVTTGGNVGIGTTTPTDTLSVISDSATILSLTRSSSLNSVIKYSNSSGDIFTGLTSSGTSWAINDNENVSSAPLFIINSSGSAGIGVTTPSAALQISGTLRIADGGESAAAAGAGAIKYDTGALYFSDGSSWTALAAGGATITTISDLDGDTQIQLEESADEDIIRFDVGTAGETMVLDRSGTGEHDVTLDLKITSSTASQLFRTTGGGANAHYFGSASGSNDQTVIGNSLFNGYITFKPYDTEVMRIKKDGTVGIGTTTPSTTLDVSGTLRIADGGETAATAGAGAIKYDTGALYFSDGSSWTALADTGGVGATSIDELTDGKYLGLSVYLGNGAGNAVTVTTNLNNTAIGYSALGANTAGANNTAIGYNALVANQSGAFNIAVGALTLDANTSGNQNVAVGDAALSANLTGGFNTALGRRALFSNTSGSQNTALGLYTLYSNTTGNYNAALGYASARYIADGSTANETSNNSLYLGASTKALADGGTNETVIGYNATGLGSNTVVLGNDSVVTTALKGNIGIGTDSPTFNLHVRGSNKTLAVTSDNNIGPKLFNPNGVSNSYRMGLGNNLHFDGSNWIAHTDGASSGASAILGQYGPTRLTFFTIPNAGGSAQTISNADLNQYKRMTIQEDGEVGIATDNPSTALHVSGTLRIADGGEAAATAGAGAIKYDTGALYFSDGSTWTALAASGATSIDDLTDAQYAGQSVYLGTGAGAAVTITTDLYNTAVGYNALNAETNGGFNTAVGNNALLSSTTGSANTAAGKNAQSSLTTGSWNASLGGSSLRGNIAGDWNTALGFAAGRFLADGSTENTDPNESIFIGGLSKALATGNTNQIVIGYAAEGLGSNSVVLGNDSIATTALKGNVGIGTTTPSVALDVSGSIEYTGTIADVSDRRLKTDINPLPSSLEDVLALNPVSFKMKDNLDETEYGFIAQEVEEIYPLLVKTADDASQTKSLNYVGLIAPMVKAMKELKAENDTLKEQLQTFEERLEALEAN